jgi:hypothetical protein
MASSSEPAQFVRDFDALVLSGVLAGLKILGYYISPGQPYISTTQFRTKRMTPAQAEGRIKNLENWFNLLANDADKAEEFYNIDKKKFIELFNGNLAKHIKERMIKEISKGNAAQALAIKKLTQEREEELRVTYPSPLEAIIIDDVIILMLDAYRFDMRVLSLDYRTSLKQSAHEHQNRSMSRRMLRSALKLLLVAHEKIQATERLANPPVNTWQYSNRLSSYEHSRN